jgi:multicomponent Na+:H+ antiporter subunit D
MHELVPLTVAVPAIGAAAVVGVGKLVPDWLTRVAAIASAGAVAVLSTILLVGSGDRPIEYAFGGWHPRRGVVIGIEFSVEPLSAAVSALAATLMTASLVFSWRYFHRVSRHYNALMLIFLAGMAGFALSADLFNMFVFLELMGVCAFALTGYQVERPGPIQGAFNFAVTNSIGAFLVLFGIGLLYGRTGALNLAQIGEALASRPPDGLVVVAFTALVGGFLVKAGAVPFHFWLSDAYSVAPATVGVLLSGVMSDLGLHAIERVYWSAFSGVLQPEHVRPVLVGVAVLTTLVGAVMAFLQANLKRMLAYVTVSQIGLVLVGIALFTPLGLAGASVTAVAQGLARGSLFLAVGLLLHVLRRDDELRLHGRGSKMPVAASLMVIGALGLAGLPPFGTFLGPALIEEAAAEAGYGWVVPLVAAGSALAAAALLRAAGRVFRGLGSPRDALLVQEPIDVEAEHPEAHVGPRRSVRLLAPAVALLVAGLGLAFAPRIAGHAEVVARGLMERKTLAAHVLHGTPLPAAPAAPAHSVPAWTWASGSAASAAAVALAALALAGRRRPRGMLRVSGALHTLHSGVIGDYVAWLVFGTAVLGGLFALVLI